MSDNPISFQHGISLHESVQTDGNEAQWEAVLHSSAHNEPRPEDPERLGAARAG